MGRLTTGTIVIMAVHALAWLVSRPFEEAFVAATVLDPSLVLQGELWRVLTYMLPMRLGGLLADGLLWTLLMLFFFGPPVERRLGPRRLIMLWFGAAVISGVVFTLLGLATRVGYLLGCMAADLALMAAYARTNPGATILAAFVIPVKAIHLFWFMVVLRLLSIVDGWQFIWSVPGELVAAAVAWAFAGGWDWHDLNPVDRIRNWRYRRKMLKYTVVQGGAARRDDPSRYLH